MTHRVRLGSSAAAFISSMSISQGSYAAIEKDSSGSDASLSPVAKRKVTEPNGAGADVLEGGPIGERGRVVAVW